MIDLVAVSYSARAAEGIAKAVAQMGDGNARIIPVGGDEDDIGASPDRICEGIEEADNGDGVVVLVDLGSAVMSAELAIETTMNSEAVIVDALVLEGTLNAAVGTTNREVTLDSVVERAEGTHDYRKPD